MDADTFLQTLGFIPCPAFFRMRPTINSLVTMADWVSVNIGDSVIHIHTGQLRTSTTYIINISDDTLSKDSDTGPIPSKAYAVSGIAGLGLNHDLVQQGKNWVTKTQQSQYEPTSPTETATHQNVHAARHQVLMALLTSSFMAEGVVSLNTF